MKMKKQKRAGPEESGDEAHALLLILHSAFWRAAG
jgi:hypothetical protein